MVAEQSLNRRMPVLVVEQSLPGRKIPVSVAGRPSQGRKIPVLVAEQCL